MSLEMCKTNVIQKMNVKEEISDIQKISQSQGELDDDFTTGLSFIQKICKYFE